MAGDTFVTCCILLAYYVLCVIISEIAFRYLDGRKYKGIKRERKFLHALIKDYEEVSESAKLITQEASPFLDADLIQDGIIRVLTEEERCWILKAKKVVIESATPFIQSFENLRKRRKSLKWYACVLADPVPMVSASFAIKWLEEKIPDNFGIETNTYARKITKSLKKSRSEVRSLLDRAGLDEIEFVKSRQLVGLTADGLIFSLKSLMIDNPGLMRGMEVQIISFRMHLQQLNAFMKDLQCQIKVLESQVESCWVVEAIETFEEAKDVIDNISRAAKQTRSITSVSYLINWKARRKLRKDIMYVCDRIYGLVETIGRYGIKFLRADSSKPSQKQTIDQHQAIQQTNLSSSSPEEVVEFIRNWLDRLPATNNKLKEHVNSLRKELKDMMYPFNHTKGTEDCLINLRHACLEELKSICEAQMEDANRGPSKFLSEIIIAIKDAVQLVTRCIEVYSIKVTWSKDSRSAVGLEDDIDNLVSVLINKSSEHPSIICIWGMIGIGKTTVAKKVYYQKTIVDHFEVKRWVSIPQVSNENLLLGNVGKQVLLEKLETDCNMGNDYWINEMREFLKERKCLLVLDNVWSKEAWQIIKPTFSEISEGSKIMVITSTKAIALHAGENSIDYPIRLRTKDESWKLFNQMVEYSPGDKKGISIAKKIVDSVGGLPLGIIRVGYQLWGKKVEEEILSGVLERINHGQNRIPWSDNLAAHMEELQRDQVLWECFSYFQLFPKDVEIPTRRIVSSLVAPGMVKPCAPYQYIMKLIELNLVQVIQRKPDGKVKTCRLPTPVRDLLLQGQGNGSEIRSGSSLGFNFDNNGQMRKNSPNTRQNESYDKFILFIDTREGNKPQQEIGEYLRSGIADGLFQQLQFLDLEGVFQPQLPKTLGTLKQLAYLGLRRTYLETVPLSIGDLVNLHTLDLKHTYIQTLHSSIWKLGNLQYLYLNHNCQMPEPNAVSMSNLQILSGVLVHTVNHVKVWLDKLIKLRKLELAFQIAGPDQKVLYTWIAKLTELEVLKLRSIDEKKAPLLLSVDNLSQLGNLSNLYLFGRLGIPTVINSLPHCLKHLTLSASEIEDNPMPVLGKLPNLRSLSLFSKSYKGKDLVCSQNGFPRLLVLKLWNLDSLENLHVAGAMHKLRKFDIRSCSKLKIPGELKHLLEPSASQPA